MKKIQYTLILWITMGTLIAQKAPNFNLTDIEGNEHKLYAYVENDKMVLLDFSTTWCNPCWKIHQAHFLDRMNTIFGPNGSDQLRVLFIESDTTTNLEDLKGTGTNTLGNWVDGITYPVIDLNPENIHLLDKDHYNINAYPTLLMISPIDTSVLEYQLFDNAPTIEKASSILFNNTKPKSGKDLQISLIETKATACDMLDGSFYAVNSTKGDFQNPEFQIRIDGIEKENITYQGTIQSQSLKKISFKDLNIEQEQDKVLEVIYLGEDDNLNNNVNSTILKKVAVDNKISFQVKTDKYAMDDESKITIYDENELLIYDSGVLENNNEFEAEVILPNVGCYKIILKDGVGDGFGFPVIIKDGLGYQIFNQINNAKEYTIPIMVDKVSGTANAFSSNRLNVAPNPSDGFIHLEFPEYTELKGELYIYDINGQIIFQSTLLTNTNRSSKKIDITSLQSGSYFVRVKSNSKNYVSGFIKI